MNIHCHAATSPASSVTPEHRVVSDGNETIRVLGFEMCLCDHSDITFRARQISSEVLHCVWFGQTGGVE